MDKQTTLRKMFTKRYLQGMPRILRQCKGISQNIWRCLEHSRYWSKILLNPEQALGKWKGSASWFCPRRGQRWGEAGLTEVKLVKTLIEILCLPAKMYGGTVRSWLIVGEWPNELMMVLQVSRKFQHGISICRALTVEILWLQMLHSWICDRFDDEVEENILGPTIDM